MADYIAMPAERAAACILSEAAGQRSRDNITIESGAGVVKANTVLGKKSTGGASSAVKAGGNTGDGTFVLNATTPVRAGAIPGIYKLRAITAVVNGGVFRLEDPNGVVLGDYTILAGAGGVITVDDQIMGVLTDGAIDFVVGDGFDITVAAGAGKWVPATNTGVTGAQNGTAINLYEVDATSADVKVAALTGDCEVNGKVIVYGATVDDDTKKARQVASLATVGIKVR